MGKFVTLIRISQRVYGFFYLSRSKTTSPSTAFFCDKIYKNGLHKHCGGQPFEYFASFDPGQSCDLILVTLTCLLEYDFRKLRVTQGHCLTVSANNFIDNGFFLFGSDQIFSSEKRFTLCIFHLECRFNLMKIEHRLQVLIGLLICSF